MPLVTSLSNNLLDQLLGTSGLLPATVYVGLMTAEPNADGTNAIEPSGFGYARIPIGNNGSEWLPASNAEKVHVNDIVFPAANGGSWGTITHGGIFDALTGGSLRLFGQLNEPRLVPDGDVFRMLATKPLKLVLG